jgi:uncharacterized protein YggE
MLRIAALFLITLTLHAQRTPSIRATGEGVVSAVPDLVKVSLTITTQANTAQEAADQNATTSQAVNTRVKALIGTNGDVKTVAYSVNPSYRTVPNGGQALTGFFASNTLEVTSYDLNLAGRIVDAATQAGASSVSGLRFGLKDSEPQRREALKRATQTARASATAIAEGLSVRLGNILAADEGVSYSPSPIDFRSGGAGATVPSATTFDTGLVEVRATVTLELAILQ